MKIAMSVPATIRKEHNAPKIEMSAAEGDPVLLRVMRSPYC